VRVIATVLTAVLAVASPAMLAEQSGAGDLFPDPADRAGLTFSNASSGEPAKLLLCHVTSR
jgi:hypothetical protein